MVMYFASAIGESAIGKWNTVRIWFELTMHASVWKYRLNWLSDWHWWELSQTFLCTNMRFQCSHRLNTNACLVRDPFQSGALLPLRCTSQVKESQVKPAHVYGMLRTLNSQYWSDGKVSWPLLLLCKWVWYLRCIISWTLSLPQVLICRVGRYRLKTISRYFVVFIVIAI